MIRIRRNIKVKLNVFEKLSEQNNETLILLFIFLVESMPGYFQNMPQIGAPLIAANAENETELRKIEDSIQTEIAGILDSGRTDESLNKAGQLTAMQRLNHLIVSGSWFPLDNLYNAGENADDSAGVIIGYNFSQKIRVIPDILCELNTGISLSVERWRFLQKNIIRP